MPVGALVAIPELQAEGVARLLEAQGTQTKIRFLASGAEKVQPSRQIVRYALLPGTEVMVGDARLPRAARAFRRKGSGAMPPPGSWSTRLPTSTRRAARASSARTR